MTPPVSTVFVVDDDASVREAVSSLLRSVGYRPQLFASAQDFLASAKADTPACLLLDVRMRGLGGLDCQRALSEAGLFRLPGVLIGTVAFVLLERNLDEPLPDAVSPT